MADRLSSLRDTVNDVRSRSASFNEYKRRTGVWPFLSMVLYPCRFALLVGCIFLIRWYSSRHDLSELGSLLAYFALAFSAGLLWLRFELSVWNWELHRRALAPRRASFRLTEVPREQTRSHAGF